MTGLRSVAPGRVNLIGDHTDYTGGLVLPMAIELTTAVVGARGGNVVHLRSSIEPELAIVPLDVTDPATVGPPWARYIAGVVAVLRPTAGFRGEVTSDLPTGAGLSSSAALEVAVALALGATGPPLEVARLCREAEEAASGVPCGIMDQLVIAAGVEGHALRIDCSIEEVRPVAVPDDVAIFVVDSGQRRALATSAYAERRAQCEAAAALIGPLRTATLADVEALEDSVLQRRARHVVTENARVERAAAALERGDLDDIGAAMSESHASLRDDFDVSTDVLDDLVANLVDRDGVFGARLTGAGFGGAVVVLAHPDADVPGRRVRPSAGATVTPA